MEFMQVETRSQSLWNYTSHKGRLESEVFTLLCRADDKCALHGVQAEEALTSIIKSWRFRFIKEGGVELMWFIKIVIASNELAQE